MLIFHVFRTNNELRDSDGEVDLIEGLRSELQAMESGLRNGGLGGVDNYTDWEKKLENAKTIKEFVSIPIYVMLHECPMCNSRFLARLSNDFKLKLIDSI